MGAIPERCVDGAEGLTAAEVGAMAAEVHGDWAVEGTARIERVARARDFAHALTMLNAIGAAAEDENHHPDLSIRDYRVLTVSLSTHDAGGLTANDFVLARRIDAIVTGTVPGT